MGFIQLPYLFHGYLTVENVDNHDLDMTKLLSFHLRKSVRQAKAGHPEIAQILMRLNIVVITNQAGIEIRRCFGPEVRYRQCHARTEVARAFQLTAGFKDNSKTRFHCYYCWYSADILYMTYFKII
jgi:hypothetical protein